jgi:hypothetical protein
MISDEHLAHLLEMRRSLLREVARLDVMISGECAPARRVGACNTADLSWEAALHEAKLHLPHDRASVAMHG